MLKVGIAAGLAFAVGGCGPSKAKVAAEQAALSAWVDQLIANARASHACDAEHAAHRAALDASIASLKTLNRGLIESANAAEERAGAKEKMCEALRPQFDEGWSKATALYGAWMDACLGCATGRACVDADRRRRLGVGAKTLAAEITELEKLKADTACGRKP